jgi:uncharacterized protein YqeY
MTLEKLQSEMIQAMKSGDKFRKGVIADMIGNVKKAAIDKNCRDNITEDLVNDVLLNCKKTAQEMIDTCPAERSETLAEYKKQLEIINEFAPTLITDEAQIRTIIALYTSDEGIDLIKTNRGKIMKLASANLKGKADMSIVSKVVGDMLQ